MIRWAFAIIIVLNESALHVWSAYWGIGDIQTMLPLHACSVIIWLSAYMLITKNYTIYELVYFIGLGGAMQAVLTPPMPPPTTFHIFASCKPLLRTER